ncbi:MAG: glycoside hydrolase family 20 zincin-like fold domain-containing protein [Candidatus Limiplasma sp.]|nr:glycoside hydrolase family 20 zincin-like fold domain-containing protein [Candidatus Limiplasma sp.]
MDFLPMPHSVRKGEGFFVLRYDTRIVLENTEPSAFLYAQMLQADVQRFTGLKPAILRGTAQPGDVILRADAALEETSYRLSVTTESMLVRGGSDESLLNGVMTLSQWIQRHGARLPALEIEDQPDLRYRGYYLDCSRGRVPTLETLKRYADLLCRYKINEWQLYIEHTYLFRNLSEAWRGDTPLTAEEIMELDRYCRARHIELIPSLSSFGHMYRILSTKTCCDLCELPDSEKIPFSYTYAGDHHTLNVSNPRAVDFIKSLITEYRALFTSKKFNICCDETFDLGKGRSKALADEKGEHALYMAHVVELCRWLLSQGVTPMFWGDIMWRHPEAYAEIPEGVICLNWGYLPEQRENEVRDLAQMGATQYVCPGVCTWNRWLPLTENSYKNNRAMCGHGRKYHAIGLLNTDWGDYGHICHPWFSVPGILYGAAFAWNADNVPFDEINQAISLFEYGDREGVFMKAFVHLTDHEIFPWFNAVRWIEAAAPEKRREQLREIDPAQVPAANAAIDAALDELALAALCMEPDKRPIRRALEISATGAKLFNDIVCWIFAVQEGRELPHRDGWELAAALENWYAAYLTEWRAVSKESTLRRTQQLICRYADTLRLNSRKEL